MQDLNKARNLRKNRHTKYQYDNLIHTKYIYITFALLPIQEL